MTERPILFSAPMVRALLDGTKTQTRRVVKPFEARVGVGTVSADFVVERDGFAHGACPYGQPGDYLWVRETWYCDHFEVQGGPYVEVPGARELLVYRADGERPYEAEQPVWRPNIHMPRWASRIVLEITGVRVERLQDISDQDAIAEGIRRVGPGWERWHPDPDDTEHTGSTQKPRLSYQGLWESINGSGSWDANPWVWVVEFRRINR